MSQLFEYVVGYYVKKTDEELIKAGFVKLEDAKEYLVTIDALFMPTGFFYIDAPEGKYIYADTDWRGSKPKLFSPEEWEKAYVYDSKKDESIKIDSFLPYSRYLAIHKQNKH